jgi:hypothetical protein
MSSSNQMYKGHGAAAYTTDSEVAISSKVAHGAGESVVGTSVTAVVPATNASADATGKNVTLTVTTSGTIVTLVINAPSSAIATDIATAFSALYA